MYITSWSLTDTELEGIGVVVGLPRLAIIDLCAEGAQLIHTSEKGSHWNAKAACEFPAFSGGFAANELIHSLKELKVSDESHVFVWDLC